MFSGSDFGVHSPVGSDGHDSTLAGSHGPCGCHLHLALCVHDQLICDELGGGLHQVDASFGIFLWAVSVL